MGLQPSMSKRLILNEFIFLIASLTLFLWRAPSCKKPGPHTTQSSTLNVLRNLTILFPKSHANNSAARAHCSNQYNFITVSYPQKAVFVAIYDLAKMFFLTIWVERRHTLNLWSLIMDAKFMVLTSVSLSLTDDGVPSHSHNSIGSTVWSLLLFLARQAVFFLLVFSVCSIGCERSLSSRSVSKLKENC